MPIKFAAKLNSFSRGPRGFFVKLEIGGDDDWQELAAAPLGTSFGVVMVAIDPETGRVPEASPGGAQATVRASTGQQRDEAGKSRKRFDDLPLSTQAGILCRDERFQRWAWKVHLANGYTGAQITQEDARTLILRICNVASRADLEHADYGEDEGAAEKFRQLKARYYQETGLEAEAR